MTKLLFICSRNEIRSLTAEKLFAKSVQFQVRSAGTQPQAPIAKDASTSAEFNPTPTPAPCPGARSSPASPTPSRCAGRSDSGARPRAATS